MDSVDVQRKGFGIQRSFFFLLHNIFFCIEVTFVELYEVGAFKRKLNS